MTAELYRNIGEFNVCMELLNSINDKEYDWIVEKFKVECNNKNKSLMILR